MSMKIKMDVAKFTQLLTVLQAANSSAAKQALAEASLEFDGDKPMSVGAYWAKRPGSAPSLDLSALLG